MIFLATIFSFFLLNELGKTASPILKRYVNVEAKRFASNVINSSVNEIIEEEMTDDLFKLNSNNGKVEILDYNTKKVNHLLSKVNKEIHNRLTNLEDGKIKELAISSGFKMEKFSKNGVICKVPIGSLRKNSLFVNVGPSIPIKMSFLGQVESSLNTKIKDYGINYLAIEINILVVVEEQVVMPAMSQKEKLTIEAPITVKIIQGEIPNYYLSSLEKSSSLNVLPIDWFKILKLDELINYDKNVRINFVI